MEAIYDEIGTSYTAHRRTDPRIASQLFSGLDASGRILNIGAGSGSYEPDEYDLVAVEPSKEMIMQRASDGHPVVQAFAESLPFADNSFVQAMTVLSVHHWSDRERAFAEINRVCSNSFMVLTWDPTARPFWLTRDYFPEFYMADLHQFPPLDDFRRYFDAPAVSTVPIPEDCVDGFLAAYWKRPEAYLDAGVRRAISSFAKLDDPGPGLARLEHDLKSGRWKERNKDILEATGIDAGYRLLTVRTR